MRTVPRALALAALLAGPLAAQAPDTTLAAGTEYQVHGFLTPVRLMLQGSRYRSLWATPVAAPALPAGMTIGAGDTTQRLGVVWLWSADGTLWEYRPLDRDLVAVTPPPIRKNLLPSFIQGFNASRHPGAAPVVRVLAEAVGVAVSATAMVRLEDSLLPSGEPGRLGYIVEASTAGLTTLEALDSLRQGGGRDLDARAYLRERLLDTYLGTWDDLPEEWRWQRAPATGLWTPEPRSRERAFVKYDGFLAQLARRSVPGFVNFGVEYQERLGVMPYQRTLDRQLLALLDWSAWDSLATSMQSSLSDSVIDLAVSRLPQEYLPEGAEPLAAALRARRDNLSKAARGLYRLVNQEVAFFGTPAADTVLVSRQRDGSMDLQFQTGFHRHIGPGESDAVALYLEGGADRVELAGPGSAGPLLDIAWRPGLSIDGPRRSGQRTTIYGLPTARTRIRADLLPDTLPVPEVEDLDLLRPPTVPLHGTDIGPNVWFDVNSDVGLLLGGGATFTTYRVGHDPFYRKLRIRSGYATAVNNYAIEMKGEFRRWRSREAMTLDAGLSEIAVLHFFGYGNTTPFVGPASFYGARQRQLYVYPAWNYLMTPTSRVTVGPVFKHVRTDTTANFYINQTRPYGVPEFAQAGVAATATYDTRDARRFTRSGLYLTAGGSFYPVVFDYGSPFGSMEASAAAYVTLPDFPRLTLAVRASGRLTMGDVPVHEAAFLGGSKTVRGYEAGRYAGEASAYFNSELRVHLATLPFVVPWHFGVVAIGDLGRVFNVTDDVNVWHGGAGGGIWFALPSRALGGVMTIVGSPQGTAIWFGTGFMF